MRAGGDRALPADLAVLAGRFLAWRRSRTFGTRIPDSLWRAAVGGARRHGVSQTAAALQLGYYALKKRVEQSASASEQSRESLPSAAFVELPASSVAGPVECLIEFEKPGGSRLRIQLKGAGIPDLAALGHGFWGSR